MIGDGFKAILVSIESSFSSRKKTVTLMVTREDSTLVAFNLRFVIDTDVVPYENSNFYNFKCMIAFINKNFEKNANFKAYTDDKTCFELTTTGDYRAAGCMASVTDIVGFPYTATTFVVSKQKLECLEGELESLEMQLGFGNHSGSDTYSGGM